MPLKPLKPSRQLRSNKERKQQLAELMAVQTPCPLLKDWEPVLHPLFKAAPFQPFKFNKPSQPQ